MKEFVPLLAVSCLLAIALGPPSTAALYDNVCRLHKNGTNLRDPYTCAGYITCVDGTAVSTACPKGQLYSIDKSKCLASDEECENPCAPDYDGIWAADPRSCKGYYYCRNGTSLFGTCPGDLHFDEDSQRCVYEWESTCEGDEYCHITPNDVKFQKPGSCTEYYACKKGVLKVNNCSSGQAFDKDIGDCKEDTSVPGCEIYCKKAKNKFVIDYKTCRGYYYCADRGTDIDLYPLWNQCPEGTFFDESAQACGDPVNIKCKYDRCDGRSDIFVNSGTNCMHYLTCKGGVTIREKMCSGYTFFDEKRQICTTDVITYPACV